MFVKTAEKSLSAKQALRRAMREKRRALTPSQRRQAAQRLLRHARQLPALHEAQHIALYLAFDGELDPSLLVTHLWKMGKKVYLPVLCGLRPGHLRFVLYTPSSKLRPNRFGIPEPVLKASVPGKKMDVVLTPLTAFDRLGGRLGMGGGFYDRTFPARASGLSRKPMLLGVAYRFQQVERLSLETHDRRINGVITD